LLLHECNNSFKFDGFLHIEKPSTAQEQPLGLLCDAFCFDFLFMGREVLAGSYVYTKVKATASGGNDA
jgi:hypothetical protein